MSKRVRSEIEARFIIKQHRRTRVGKEASDYVERKFDTDYMDSHTELRLIEAYIDGWGKGYQDARKVSLMSNVMPRNYIDHGECDPGAVKDEDFKEG